MQAVNTTRREAVRRSKTKQRVAPTPRRASSCAHRVATSNVLTLAPASVLSLPSLAGVRQSYEYHMADDTLIPVAEYLIEQGHGTRRDWTESGHDIRKFIERTIDNLIHSTGYTHVCGLSDGPNLTAALADRTYWLHHFEEVEGDSLRLVIEVADSGWFRMGNAIRKLEREAKGLGAAFYAVLSDALGALCWVYDYQNASYAAESKMEQIADEENVGNFEELTQDQRKSYDLWNPDAAVPPSILKTVKTGKTPKNALKLLRRHANGRNRRLIEPLLQLAALEPKMRQNLSERPHDPLPSFVTFFSDHDDITAAFDDYAQTALEGDQSQVFIKPFNPQNRDSIAQAFESFTTAVTMYGIADRLSTAINGRSKSK